MKLLVFIHEYPPVGGGGGHVAQNLCRGLQELGHEIQIITSRHGDLPAMRVEEGIRVHRIWCARKTIFKASFFSMILYVLGSFFKGLKIAFGWKPDLLHAHFAVPAGASAWAISRFTRIPYIITAHGGDVPGAAPEKTAGWFRFVLPFTHPIWNKASRIIAVSDHFKTLAKKYYSVEMDIIPNGFSLGNIQPGKFMPGKTPIIIYAGRFSPEKNPLMIVHTLAEIKDLNWECVLLGDGIQMDAIRRSVEKYKLKNRIHLPGWVDEAEVLNWMSKSDILFMPSLAEGLPIAGLQGLAMGLALVLSRVGSCVNLVNPGQNGFLVEASDLKGYSTALRKLLMDTNLLRKFRKASLVHSKQFQMKAVVDSYNKIYDSLFKGPDND